MELLRCICKILYKYYLTLQFRVLTFIQIAVLLVYTHKHTHKTIWGHVIAFSTKNKVCTYNIYELWQFELDFNSKCICHIHYRPDQLVVVTKQVIIEALGVWVSGTPCNKENTIRNFFRVIQILINIPEDDILEW